MWEELLKIFSHPSLGDGRSRGMASNQTLHGISDTQGMLTAGKTYWLLSMMSWNCFLNYWPFKSGIHQWLVVQGSLFIQISGHSPIKILKVLNMSKLRDNFCIYWCECYMSLRHLGLKCPVTKFGQQKPCSLPSQRANNGEIWCFLCCQPEHAVEQIFWDAMMLKWQSAAL